MRHGASVPDDKHGSGSGDHEFGGKDLVVTVPFYPVERVFLNRFTQQRGHRTASALTGNNPNLLAGSYQSRRANLATLVEFLDRSKRVLPVGKSLSGHAS